MTLSYSELQHRKPFYKNEWVMNEHLLPQKPITYNIDETYHICIYILDRESISVNNTHWNYDFIFTKHWKFWNSVQVNLSLVSYFTYLPIVFVSTQPYPVRNQSYNETGADLAIKWSLNVTTFVALIKREVCIYMYRLKVYYHTTYY